MAQEWLVQVEQLYCLRRQRIGWRWKYHTAIVKTIITSPKNSTINWFLRDLVANQLEEDEHNWEGDSEISSWIWAGWRWDVIWLQRGDRLGHSANLSDWCFADRLGNLVRRLGVLLIYWCRFGRILDLQPSVSRYLKQSQWQALIYTKIWQFPALRCYQHSAQLIKPIHLINSIPKAEVNKWGLETAMWFKF